MEKILPRHPAPPLSWRGKDEGGPHINGPGFKSPAIMNRALKARSGRWACEGAEGLNLNLKHKILTNNILF